MCLKRVEKKKLLVRHKKIAKWLFTGAHLGFSESRGPNFRKGANQYNTES